MNDLINQILAQKSCCADDKPCGTGSQFMNFDHYPNLREDQVHQAFFDRFIDQSQFLRDINTFQVNDCRGVIPRVDSCSIVTQPKCGPSCHTDGLDLDISYQTYELVKYKTVLNVGEDFLDCNKLGTPEFINNYLQNLLMGQWANNMARLAILGSEDYATGSSESRLNNLLGGNDGFLKLFCECTPECQVIDAKGMGFSRELYMAARKKLPAQFRSMRNNFQFIGGISQTDWLAEITSYRPTDKGDQACETGQVGRLWGNSFYELPEWPENLPYDVTDAAGNPTGETKEVTHLVFTTLDNMNYIQRKAPRILTDFCIDSDSTKTVIHSEADFSVNDERRVVLIRNVDVCSDTPWSGCCKPCPDNCTFDFSDPCTT